MRTLLAQTAPVGDFEILIVDGMSNDGTRDVLRRLASQNARLRLVDNPLGITPCGMNCGIRTATGHWIAIMGSHDRYAPDYRLGAGRVAHNHECRQRRGSHGLRRRVVVPEGDCGGSSESYLCGVVQNGTQSRLRRPADTVLGVIPTRSIRQNWLFRREPGQKPDDELNLRLTRAGGQECGNHLELELVSPAYSLRALLTQYRQYGYWKVRVIQKHKLPASWRHLVPALLCSWCSASSRHSDPC